MSTDAVVCNVLNTGWATPPEWILLRGGGLARVPLPALVALLRHPRHGCGLFDAGYSPRVASALTTWPFLVYRWTAPMTPGLEGPLVAQLPRYGVTARDIEWIIISHFHADHIGGLQDFPGARFIASRLAYEDVCSRTGWSALRRAFVPELMPRDFEMRASLINGPANGPAFAHAHDLFDDGVITLVNLPGHARGQIGARVRTTAGSMLFAADGCWMSRSARENRPPHRVTRLFVDCVEAAEHTVAVLHGYAAAHPDVAIVPSHCPEAYARYVAGGVG
jgi:glyoxylase-like metal-dependent hydrolase (beta-lactamase superfamily II)